MEIPFDYENPLGEDHSSPDPPAIPRVTDPKFQGLASDQGYDQSYSRIERVKYTHDAMIDMIILEPSIKQGELAARFGYTQAWISRIIGSDAFQAKLAVRKEQLVDPFLLASMEERIRGLAMQSLDVIATKLDATQSADIALKALDISVKALGFGARDRGGGQINANFVVNMPGKAQTAEEWASAYAPAQKAIDVLPMSSTITRDPTVQPEAMKIAEDE